MWLLYYYFIDIVLLVSQCVYFIIKDAVERLFSKTKDGAERFFSNNTQNKTNLS